MVRPGSALGRRVKPRRMACTSSGLGLFHLYEGAHARATRRFYTEPYSRFIEGVYKRGYMTVCGDRPYPAPSTTSTCAARGSKLRESVGWRAAIDRGGREREKAKKAAKPKLGQHDSSPGRPRRRASTGMMQSAGRSRDAAAERTNLGQGTGPAPGIRRATCDWRRGARDLGRSWTFGARESFGIHAGAG